MTVLSAPRRLAERVPRRAILALGAQIVLAFGSLVLQVLGSRELGPERFGTFAILFGSIVMATALTTGLLGDSLTVLDRHDPHTRTALFTMSLALIALLAGTAFVIGLAYLDSTLTALLFSVALAAFVAADLSRRLLMANLKFGSLVIADSLAFVPMISFLATFLILGRTLHLNHFLAAMAITQAVACCICLSRLPEDERGLPRLGRGGWRAVFRFGVWRAIQQFVRPTMLNAARGLVLIAASAAAVGQLEAARVFVAPAMLLVQGVGSYLFASYAADRRQETGLLLRRADRAATVMLVGAALIASVGVFFIPLAGDLVTAGLYPLSQVAVLGWACYAASCAAVLPYGSLAAVIGKQQWVLGVRVTDSAFSLGLVALLLLAWDVNVVWMPWILSVGSFLGGLLCRQALLRPAVFHEGSVRDLPTAA